MNLNTQISNDGKLNINSEINLYAPINTDVISNNYSGIVTINDGTLAGGGGIYNIEGGVININGGYITGHSSYGIFLESIVSNSTLNITGGHIRGETYGIQNSDRRSSSDITIGSDTLELSNTTPEIRGGTYGISGATNLKFYNGIIRGETSAYNTEPATLRSGCKVANGAEVIDGVTYQTAYLEPNVFEEQGTINGEPGSYQNPTIPAGYIPLDTEEAKWNNPDGPQWNDGLVITDDLNNGNEWVWVPVEDPSVMYEENATGVALSGSTGVSTTRYSASGIISGKSRGLPGSTSYREPDLVLGSGGTSYDYSNYSTAGFSSLSNMANTMVSEYSTMIDSINKYGGFYIGRYELTANGTKPGTVLTNTDWYTLYKNCTTLAKSGSNTMSRMIWGAQWDVTCLWLQQSGYDINDSSSYGNYYDVDVYSSDGTEIIKPNGTSQKLETGITTFTRANNVYDLAGNCYEWTQEAYGTNGRVGRGGNYNNNGSYFPVADRYYDFPTGSRSSLRFTSYFNPNATISSDSW